jgi:hypothetical protein
VQYRVFIAALLCVFVFYNNANSQIKSKQKYSYKLQNKKGKKNKRKNRKIKSMQNTQQYGNYTTIEIGNDKDYTVMVKEYAREKVSLGVFLGGNVQLLNMANNDNIMVNNVANYGGFGLGIRGSFTDKIYAFGSTFMSIGPVASSIAQQYIDARLGIGYDLLTFGRGKYRISAIAGGTFESLNITNSPQSIFNNSQLISGDGIVGLELMITSDNQRNQFVITGDIGIGASVTKFGGLTNPVDMLKASLGIGIEWKYKISPHIGIGLFARNRTAMHNMIANSAITQQYTVTKKINDFTAASSIAAITTATANSQAAYNASSKDISEIMGKLKTNVLSEAKYDYWVSGVKYQITTPIYDPWMQQLNNIKVMYKDEGNKKFTAENAVFYGNNGALSSYYSYDNVTSLHENGYGKNFWGTLPTFATSSFWDNKLGGKAWSKKLGHTTGYEVDYCYNEICGIRNEDFATKVNFFFGLENNNTYLQEFETLWKKLEHSAWLSNQDDVAKYINSLLKSVGSTKRVIDGSMYYVSDSVTNNMANYVKTNITTYVNSTLDKVVLNLTDQVNNMISITKDSVLLNKITPIYAKIAASKQDAIDAIVNSYSNKMKDFTNLDTSLVSIYNQYIANGGKITLIDANDANAQKNTVMREFLNSASNIGGFSNIVGKCDDETKPMCDDFTFQNLVLPVYTTVNNAADGVSSDFKWKIDNIMATYYNEAIRILQDYEKETMTVTYNTVRVDKKLGSVISKINVGVTFYVSF